MRYAHFTALLFVQLAEKVQNNYLLVYPTYISCLDLVIPTLNRPLSLKGYIFWTYETYDVSTDGEHQEEQPGRRGPATTTSYHYGAVDDDANPVASTNGSEHAEYGA